MEEKEIKIVAITEAIKKQILSLTSARRTGKVLLTLIVELDLSQGYIGSAAISNNSKERIF